MTQFDKDYLLARAEKERDQAASASDETVRLIHLKLAREYEARAAGGGTPPIPDTAVLGGPASKLKLL